jgi:hypothetical protein
VDCAQTLDLDGVAMTLMNDDGQQAVIAWSDPLAARLENMQFELGEGPCVDASRENRPALHPDLAADAGRRWTVFGPAALDAGVLAIFAIPLQVGAVRLGSLGLYARSVHDLDRSQLDTSFAYADAAVVVLLHIQSQMFPAEGLHPDLGDPLDRRAEVHQATGMVSVHADVGITEAVLLLRANAFTTGRPLLSVAREVLAGRLRINPHMGEDE